MSLVFAYMKMLDPNSTVREGEQAQARNAGSVDEKIYNLYNQARSGQSLNPRQRKDMYNQASLIYNQQQGKQAELQQEYTDIASRSGANPQNVITAASRPQEKSEKKQLTAKQKEVYEKIKDDPVKLKKFKERAAREGYSF